MGRARENFNDVYFKDLRGQQMSFAGYANVLRHIFWNLMDGHSMVRESEKCNYTIEAWGRRCYLVQTNRETKAIDRYEILNCTYEQLRGKISKRHTKRKRFRRAKTAAAVRTAGSSFRAP